MIKNKNIENDKLPEFFSLVDKYKKFISQNSKVQIESKVYVVDLQCDGQVYNKCAIDLLGICKLDNSG